MSLTTFFYSLSKTIVKRLFIDTSEKGHFTLLLGQPQANNSMYYQNSSTYFSIMGNKENNWEQFMHKYNADTGNLDTMISWGQNVNGDYHSQAYVDIDDNNMVVTYHEAIHNDTVVIKRGLVAESITDGYETIQTFTNAGTGLELAYPNPQKDATYRYLFFRDFSSGSAMTYSSDGGDTWATPIVTSVLSNTDKWAYPRVPAQATVPVFFVNVRDQDIGDGSDYTSLYAYKPDGTTLSNLDGTFSKDVSVTNITNAEMASDCYIGDPGYVNGIVEDTPSKYYLLAEKTNIYTITDGVLSSAITISDPLVAEWKGDKISIVKTGADSFSFISYVKGSDSADFSVVVKTSDGFSNYTVEKIIAEKANNPMLAQNYNASEESKQIILARKSGVYTSGPLVEPVDSYSDAVIFASRDIN